MLKAWQSITLWKRVLIGLVIGLVIGLTMRYTVPTTEKTHTQNLESGITSAEIAGWDVSVGDEVKANDKLGTLTVEETSVVLLASTSGTVSKLSGAAGGSVTSGQNLLVITEPLSGPEHAAWLADDWIQPWGQAFYNLIYMLIVPLIATTLVAGVTAMGDPKKLGSLGARTIVLYLLTTFFAVSLGLAAGTIFQPGKGVTVSRESASADALSSVSRKLKKADEAGSVGERILNIIPTNPVRAMSEGNVLPTIFFSILLGIGILFAGKAAKPVQDFFESASEVMMRLTILIMELAPLGVLALMAWVMAKHGIEVLVNLLWLAVALYSACIIQIVFVYGILIVKCVLRLPLVQFFRGIVDAQGIAFSTASSNATLPVTISCAETNLGVDKSVAGSVLPLGATINMDGTAIYLGIVALFAAQASGLELTMTNYVMVALTATLVSIGAAGIPSAGLLLAATVLEVVGIPGEQALIVIAFIFPFDRLLDMMRTVTNVTGDLAVACTVAKWEGELDEDVFRREAEV